MKRKFALIMISGAAVAGIAAPTAFARPTCHEAGVNTICRTNGSINIKARPGTTAPPANQPIIPWIGAPGRRR